MILLIVKILYLNGIGFTARYSSLVRQFSFGVLGICLAVFGEVKGQNAITINNSLPYLDDTCSPSSRPINKRNLLDFFSIPDSVSVEKLFVFSFHQEECAVRISDAFFEIRGPKTKVEDCLKKFNKLSYNKLIYDCGKLKKKLKLGDWGYISLLKSLGDACYTEDHNMSMLFQFSVLQRSGYQVALYRDTVEDKLYLGVPFSENLVWGLLYESTDGKKFYILTKEKEVARRCRLLKKSAEKGKIIPSLLQGELPEFPYKHQRERLILFEGKAILVKPNQNLIDFYASYPVNPAYANRVYLSLSDEIKKDIYPYLEEILMGKPIEEAVNTLLHFVQQSFIYQSDCDQFGDEKPFFADESFFYPYNDCEDRAILFAVLVRELLRMDVVLVDYGTHLATAVRMDYKEIEGKYFDLQGSRYYSCDPSNGYSCMGEVMEEYQKSIPKIIRIE